MWDVHDDPAMYVGGLRSLMLQTLHPLAMAGVAGHSGYRSDPWGRLQRTGSYIAHTTYAPISTATAMIERVVQVHRRIRGEAPDGRRYRADDPDLLLWVHVSEIDSFLRAHVAFGRRKLTSAEQDDYVRQTAISARLLGVKDAPESVAELRATLHRFLPELMGSPQALDTIKFLVSQPPVPAPVKPAYWLLAAGAISILPRWVRQELELPDSPFLDRWLWRPTTSALVSLLRWVMDDPSIAELKMCPASIVGTGSTPVPKGLSDQPVARKMWRSQLASAPGR